jgi:hypothetical protein
LSEGVSVLLLAAERREKGRKREAREVRELWEGDREEDWLEEAARRLRLRRRRQKKRMREAARTATARPETDDVSEKNSREKGGIAELNDAVLDWGREGLRIRRRTN